MINPWWIVLFVFGWIGLGTFGLIVFWKTRSGLSGYFENMRVVPAQEKARFELPKDNPLQPKMSIVEQIKQRRVLNRLMIWGAPPILGTPDDARAALKSARVWGCAGLLPVLCFLAFFAMLSLKAFLFLGGIWAFCLFFTLPSNWRSHDHD
jgi:hypothetical protein